MDFDTFYFARINSWQPNIKKYVRNAGLSIPHSFEVLPDRPHCISSCKTFLERPNTIDIKGTHQCGGLVEVTCDVQKGGEERLVGR